MSQTEFTDAKLAVEYTLMGRAVITLQSQQSGKHFTYKIRRDPNREGGRLYWVSILTEGDQYQVLGALVPVPSSEHLVLNPKTDRRGSMSVMAFNYFWESATVKKKIGKSLRVMHEGTCGCCGRPLTHPESLERGLGPYCAEAKGLAA